jgi:hypothetical protein
MPDAAQTYYEILGISQDATPDEVASARRIMLKAVHPDLATDEADRVEREQLSRTVNDICDTLLDPLARYDYDRSLARAPRSPGGVPTPDGAAADASELDEDAPGDIHIADEDGDGDRGHPLVERFPGLARIEAWLTWPVAGLAFVMFCLAVYLYDTVGGQVLDAIGLHFGRFGSLGVVILMTVVLVAAVLGLVRLLREVRSRARPG